MRHIRSGFVIAAIAVLLIGIVAVAFSFKSDDEKKALSGVEDGRIIIRGIPIDGLDIDVTKSSEAAEPVEFFGDTGLFDMSFLGVQTEFNEYEAVLDVRPKDKETVYFCGGIRRDDKTWPIGYCEKIEDGKVVSAQEVEFSEGVHPDVYFPEIRGNRIDVDNSVTRMRIPFSEPGLYRATQYIYEYSGGKELGQRYEVSFYVDIKPQKEDVELLDVYYATWPAEPRFLTVCGVALRTRNEEAITLEQVEWYNAQTQTVLSGDELSFVSASNKHKQLYTFNARLFKADDHSIATGTPKIGDKLTLTFRDEHDSVFVIHLSL